MNNSRIKVCSLSGCSEIGRNSNFVEYNGDIIIIDFGISFPSQELLGIDYTIPNFSYLKKNKHRIKGILITHGHLDHQGGLPYVLKELDYPTIYCGRFARELIKLRLDEHEHKGKYKFKDVFRSSELNIGNFQVKFIGVTHGIPDAFSIFVQTPGGNVFFSGDYKIDTEPVFEPETDYESLKELRGKVDLALMESTNARKSGKVMSEREVADNLEKVIRSCNHRVVVAMFGSLVWRLHSTINIAKKTGRYVFVSGRSLRNNVEIGRQLGILDIPEGLVKDERTIEKYPPDKVMYICTGSQGERYSALNRISLGEHKFFKLKKTDTILLSSSEIPDNATNIEKMTSRIIKSGSTVYQSDYVDIHESGHGTHEDYKIMLDLIRPKYVMPNHGSTNFRYRQARNYEDWGMPEDKVLLTDDGQVWEYDSEKWIRASQVESKAVLIDGNSVGETEDIVLKDRTQLSQFGVVTVILNISDKDFSMRGKPRMISRGFVYVKKSQKLFNALEAIVINTHKQWVQDKKHKALKKTDLQNSINKALGKHIYHETIREPVILTIII